MITVIPLLYVIIPVHKTIVFQHLSDLCIREAKVFIVLDILYRVNIKIIQSCENTFFRNSKAPRQHSKIQTVVGLERIPEQAPDQIHHVIVIP